MGQKSNLLCINVLLFTLGGCVNGVKPSEYSRHDIGQVVQVEACIVISQRPVVISSWLPFGAGPRDKNRAPRERMSRQRRGISYVVKIEKTGEMLAITQAADVAIPNGAQAWVEFGDRVRLSPR